MKFLSFSTYSQWNHACNVNSKSFQCHPPYMSTQEQYEDQNILKLVLMAEAPLWDTSSHEFSRLEESMFDYRGWFVNSYTPPRVKLFISYVTSYAYDAANIMDNNNYDTVLEHFVITSSLWVAQVNTVKVTWLDNLVIAKKWGILPKKALNMIHGTTQHGIHTALHPSLSWQFSTNNHHWLIRDYHIMFTMIDCLSLQCLGEETGVHRFLPPT